MLETITNTPKLFSLTGHESPSLPILPDELILDILLRVPVRSLLRFRCVCKSWKTLISDPQFAKDHLRISTADSNMAHQRLVYRTTGHHEVLSFSVQSLFQNPSTLAKPRFFMMMSDMYIILGSCNGLLCLCDSLHGYVKLWNPSIGLISKTLPTGVSLDEDISCSGFGYDHVNDKYKLLVVVEDLRRETETATKIYTFGSNSCRVIQNFPWSLMGRVGKFLSGTLNWIARRGDQWVILSIDLGTETCGEVLLPDGNRDNICNIPVLNILRDCLCVSFLDSKKTHWVVWLMKEYGVQDSWTKLMTIPFFVEGDSTWNKLMMFPCDEHSVRLYPSLDLLCISENDVVMLEANNSKIVLYNSNDARLDYPRITVEHRWYGLHIYHESLVSPPC